MDTDSRFAIVWKIAAGALIPSLATILFNILHFFFENYGKIPLPELSASVYDIGVGCAFSLIGICVTTNDHAASNRLLILFVILLLALIFGTLIAPVLLKWNESIMTWLLNLFSFFLLSWAIADAE